MKRKPIVLFILCALLLFGCLGCGAKAVPKLDPIVSSSAKGLKPVHTFNIKTPEFVEAFNAYSKGKGALPLEDGVFFKFSIFSCGSTYTDQRTFLLYEDKKTYTTAEIVFYTSIRTRKVSSLWIAIPTTLDNEEIAKTGELFLNFALELLEPNKCEQLKTEIHSFLSNYNSIGEESSENKEFLGENSILFVHARHNRYSISIEPNVQ